MQAVAASAHMIVARHLKDEDTNVCLLYLSSIHALSSIAGSIILRAFQLPRSWAVAGLLAATCEQLPLAALHPASCAFFSVLQHEPCSAQACRLQKYSDCRTQCNAVDTARSAGASSANGIQNTAYMHEHHADGDQQK